MADAKKRVVVLGGGPGGYVAAIRAAQMGGRVTLVEKDAMGGTCLNRGCVPTKFLIHATDILWQANHAQEMGLSFGDATIDLARMMKRKEAIVDRLRSGVDYLMKKNRIEVVRGTGSLLGQGRVAVGGTQPKALDADRVIIATGSQPASIPVKGAGEKGVMNSNEVLSLTQYPASMTIIGGGVVGVEFAQILNRLGTRVTIVEMMPRILPGEDEEISSLLRDLMRKEGIEVYVNARVTAMRNGGPGKTSVLFGDGAGEKEVSSERVLVAVGRKPYVEGLGVEKLGMALTKEGRVAVDDHMETNVKGIYAIGDVLGRSMLAHVAMAEGICAAENAMGRARRMDYTVVPRCVYSSPEVAGVGLTEAEAKVRHGDGNVITGRFPFVGNSKGVITDETSGMVKIVAESRYRQVLGLQMIGPHATELIAEAGLAIRLEATMEEIASTIHAHPTLSEAIAEASLEGVGRGLHI
jgi:dihydrolipoamide dehydrogenase